MEFMCFFVVNLCMVLVHLVIGLRMMIPGELRRDFDVKRTETEGVSMSKLAIRSLLVCWQ